MANSASITHINLRSKADGATIQEWNANLYQLNLAGEIIAKLRSEKRAVLMDMGVSKTGRPIKKWRTKATPAEVAEIYASFKRLVLDGPPSDQQKRAYLELANDGFATPPTAGFFEGHTYASLSNLIGEGRANRSSELMGDFAADLVDDMAV